MKNIIITLTLVSASLLLSAQSNKEHFNLLFKAKTFTPEVNAEKVIRKNQLGEIFQSKSIVLLQFYNLPSNSDKELLSRNGIVLMDYMPRNAYYAAITKGTDLSVLRQVKVRSIIEVPSKVKIDKVLLSEDLPYYTIDKASDDLIVKVSSYDVFRRDEVAKELQKLGYRILDEEVKRSTIKVIIEKDKLEDLAALPFVYSLFTNDAPAIPEDRPARSLHRSSAINGLLSSHRKYDGSGVTVAIADDGAVSHIDYQGRLTDLAGGAGGTHGDMTGGICAGAGNRDELVRGHATGAHLFMYNINSYPQIVNAVANFNNLGIRVTSTSYSQGTGGVYTNDTRDIDRDLRNVPQMMHVFSAGNAGTANHSTNAYPARWGNITGGYKAGKNVIASGNLRNQDQLETSSSRGPAEDGRIKPDLCANGYNQLSTGPNNTTQTGGGTSAAAPSIAGTVTQLYHAYKELNGQQLPDGALIKGTLQNTAEDLGRPGPDYEHGWGRIHALRAVRALEDRWYMADSVTTGEKDTFEFDVPAGTGQLRLMIHWTDFEGSATAAQALVNNLDMEVIDTAGTTYLPWVLDPRPNAATLALNATRKVDVLNNTEQVTLEMPYEGRYKVIVSGTSIPQGPQKYYMLYYFVPDEIELTWPNGGEGLIPGSTEFIRWDAYGTSGTFALEYSSDAGQNWNMASSTIPGNLRYAPWTPPISAVGGKGLLRISRAGDSDVSDTTFALLGRPNDFKVDTVCPNTMSFSWSSVNGADEYEVYKLGSKYMEPIGVTSSTNLQISSVNPFDDNWFAVAAKANGHTGTRAIAINYNGGLLNCTVDKDLEAMSIINPPSSISLCLASADSVHIKLQLRNTSVRDSASNFYLRYRLGNGPMVSDTVTAKLAPGDTLNHSFSKHENFNTPGNYDITAWVVWTNDQNQWNDSVTFTLNTITGSSVNLPFKEDFDAFPTCQTTTGCELPCALSGGWLNEENMVQDDADWRTNSGGTPSQNTGPTTDHTTGTQLGNYLYIEASGGPNGDGCVQHIANLISPCLTLDSLISPELSFWYHMNDGNQNPTTMGSLHVDLLFADTTILDIIPIIAGNQGAAWLNMIADLSAYKGKKMNVRIRGIVGTRWSSDIAIDDIEIRDRFRASFSFSGDLCKDSLVQFRNTSPAVPSDIHWWNFGPNANPPVATGAGPHLVTFNTQGAQDVTKWIRDSISGKTDSLIQAVFIEGVPVAKFGYSSNLRTVSFMDSSINGQQMAWLFGDGGFSNIANPSHLYLSNGPFTVQQIVQSQCGIDTFTQIITFNVGIEEILKESNIHVYPNPSSGRVNLDISFLPQSGLMITVEDLAGRAVYKRTVQHQGGVFSHVLNLENLENGLYVISISTEGIEARFKLEVQK